MGHRVRNNQGCHRLLACPFLPFVTLADASMIHSAVRSKLQTTPIGSFSIKSGGKPVSYQPPTKSTAWRRLKDLFLCASFAATWHTCNWMFFCCSGQWQLQTCASSWCAFAAYWDCVTMRFPCAGLECASVIPLHFWLLRCSLPQTCSTTRALQA